MTAGSRKSESARITMSQRRFVKEMSIGKSVMNNTIHGLLKNMWMLTTDVE